MAYVKTTWVAGNRLSIERLNKIEGGIVAANQLNASNAAAGVETAANLTEAAASIDQMEDYVADGNALLSPIAPPTILTNGWGLFDGGSASSSTATSVTRDFAGFTSRITDAALYQNNGGNIQILQAGTYEIIRSMRLGGSATEVEALDGRLMVFNFGGQGSGYKTIQTVSVVDVLTLAVGYQIGIHATLYGGDGMSLTFTDGKIAIRKIA